MNNFIKDWRKNLTLIAIICMLAGLLFSRALLSAGMFLFVITTCFHKNIAAQVRNFFHTPVLWLMTFLFFIPLVSGLWSSDTNHWLDIIRIRIPLLVFPFCFAGISFFSRHDWEKVAEIFLLLLLFGVIWSVTNYLQHAGIIHQNYLRSGILVTPMDNDHVRFSLLVVIGILAIFHLYTYYRTTLSRWQKILLPALGFIFIIYLHVLAARTGLLAFYITIIILVPWMLLRNVAGKKTVLAAAIILALPFIAYFAFPTFKNRLSYLRYDMTMVKNNQYRSGSNDGNRIVSIQAGLMILKEHPYSGTGFGDIEHDVQKFYASHYPQMNGQDKILPAGEWFMYGAGTGWPGIILFSLTLLLPLFTTSHRNRIIWWVINLAFALSYIADIGLEVQYGVFMHSFILLWWWHWIKTEHP